MESSISSLSFGVSLRIHPMGLVPEYRVGAEQSIRCLFRFNDKFLVSFYAFLFMVLFCQAAINFISMYIKCFLHG